MADFKRLLLVSFALLSPVAGQFKKVLTNEDVLAQAKAGTAEADLLQAINKNEVRFDTSANALIALKNAGVSENVVLGILSAARRTVAAAHVQPADAAPANNGVYLVREGKYVELAPETCIWKLTTSAWFLAGAKLTGLTNITPETVVMHRPRLSGTLPGPKSRPAVSRDAEFIIVCPAGTVSAEYRLVRIDERPDRREFSVQVQYVANAYFGIAAPGESGGRVMDIETEKIAQRTYKVKLPDLKKGQYGFLAPGVIHADSTGTVHPFEIR